MFDASLCAANDLERVRDLSRQLVGCQLERLRFLGYGRDIEFLFFAGDPCRPNWQYAADIHTEAQEIIKRIFESAHDAAHAEDELRTRALPN
jgi:hypothetical protein